MIKRISFSLHPGDDLRSLLEVAAGAPEEVRPYRVTLGRSLARHGDAIGIEWFADPHHLARFDAWAETVPVEPSVYLVADEQVMRGAEWLQQRWAAGGNRLKHLALARRAEGLTLGEFLHRWADHAGTLGGRPIPEEARGVAYIQNHPRLDGGPWPYDACTEVYVEDLAGLRARVEYLDASLADGESELFAERCFLAVEEEVLLPSR